MGIEKLINANFNDFDQLGAALSALSDERLKSVKKFLQELYSKDSEYGLAKVITNEVVNIRKRYTRYLISEEVNAEKR